MATIEERAKKLYPFGLLDYCKVYNETKAYALIRCQKAYVQGATEQQKIDIENVCNDSAIKQLGICALDPTMDNRQKYDMMKEIIKQAMEE